jgi:hypothetical protein
MAAFLLILVKWYQNHIISLTLAHTFPPITPTHHSLTPPYPSHCPSPLPIPYPYYIPHPMPSQTPSSCIVRSIDNLHSLNRSGFGLWRSYNSFASFFGFIAESSAIYFHSQLPFYCSWIFVSFCWSFFRNLWGFAERFASKYFKNYWISCCKIKFTPIWQHLAHASSSSFSKNVSVHTSPERRVKSILLINRSPSARCRVWRRY